MVEVFKTNIGDKIIAGMIVADLSRKYPGGKINFDLDDCDKVLRVENEIINPEEITEMLARKGYCCEVLE